MPIGALSVTPVDDWPCCKVPSNPTETRKEPEVFHSKVISETKVIFMLLGWGKAQVVRRDSDTTGKERGIRMGGRLTV